MAPRINKSWLKRWWWCRPCCRVPIRPVILGTKALSEPTLTYSYCFIYLFLFYFIFLKTKSSESKFSTSKCNIFSSKEYFWFWKWAKCRPLHFGRSVLRIYILVGLMDQDLLLKCHNASVPYRTMHYLVTEMCTCVHISAPNLFIMGYLPNAFRDLWDGSIQVRPSLLGLRT